MKVLIGTPAHDGRVDVWYTNSLVETIKLSYKYGVEINPVYMSYDSLVQRARNDLVRVAIEENYDALIFIDSDEAWDPEWVFSLLNRPEEVIGATVVKKSDEPLFNVKALRSGVKIEPNGLMEVECVGTGFLKIGKNALRAIWHDSPKYHNEGRICRMVFDVQLVDGELVSEDNIFCQKWRKLGGKVWIDPSMTCHHIGVKKYSGSFLAYLQSLQENHDGKK